MTLITSAKSPLCSGGIFRAKHCIMVTDQDLLGSHNSLPSPTETYTTGDPVMHQTDMASSPEMILERAGICNGSISTLGSGPRKWLLWGYLRSFCQTFCSQTFRLTIIRSTVQGPKQKQTISQHHMGKAPTETVFHPCRAPKTGTSDCVWPCGSWRFGCFIFVCV